MSILKEFYCGNVNPIEQSIKDSEYYRLNKEMTKYVDELKISLNENKKELFDKISSLYLRICYISDREAFIKGYCIGSKMTWKTINFNE